MNENIRNVFSQTTHRPNFVVSLFSHPFCISSVFDKIRLRQLFIQVMKTFMNTDNASVNSKTDYPPRGDPLEIRTFSLPEGRVFAQLSLPGGRDFKLEKSPTILKEKCRNFSICFKETGDSLNIMCSCSVWR